MLEERSDCASSHGPEGGETPGGILVKLLEAYDVIGNRRYKR